MSENKKQIEKNLQDAKRLLEEEALLKEDELKKQLTKEELLKQKLKLPEDEKKSEVTSFTVNNKGTNPTDWEKIKADYLKKYPDRSIDENDALEFDSREDAVNFFAEQAASKRDFLCKEIDASGKPTGFNVFSCGDGTLYKGSLQEILEQLNTAKKANPDDPNVKKGIATIQSVLNPTQQFRQTIQENREKTPEKVLNETPNPLDIKPNPFKK